MPALPTGTITFLFTDVEGSTRLWEQHPQVMRQVMARHDALLTDVFEQHDGVVVRPRGEGDSLFCVFVRASDAVAAALAGQRALVAEDWGEVGPLRVRMGLHTGEADLREGDYYGSAVNRCARIRAAGHGGQVLLSEATAKLAGGTLPDGASLRELGAHRLRDLSEPEQIVQLEAPGLPDAFPPLKTLDARPNNLPLQLTSFVGREQELSEITSLLGQHRLVTLTGPGGTGKTRLAQQVAADLVDVFADGIFFVDLAPLADPALVPSAVAQALGVQGLPEVPLRESVLRFLRDRQLLLVLDNYEHLLAAAEFAGALLQGAPLVSLLVTSRAPLRLPGEHEYAVQPLPLPAPASHAAGGVADNAAVALFVARAQAVRADFALDADNEAAIAAICARLDGLPLAIELAAARIRALPPAALLARLERRLPVLTGGARTVPARQQTLRGAIGWSYALLEPAEQRLFRRLGVFAGGCTLDLAEAVCNADGDLDLDVLDGVSSLVEKSLLREREDPSGEPRYRMLETIREFALGELEASGEAETVRRQLAVQVLQFARQCAAAQDWRRLDADVDNARTVLAWCVERAELAAGARLFWALRAYLLIRGRGNELEVWRRRFLAMPDAALPSISRARLLAGVPRGLFSRADQERATAELEEAVTLSHALGDTQGLAEALGGLAFLRLNQGQYDAMVPLAEEALTLYLAAGNAHLSTNLQAFLIIAAHARGDGATAEQLLAANRAREGTTRSAVGLVCEAMVAEARGDDAQTRAFLVEAVQKSAAVQGERSPEHLQQLASLARVMLRQGDTRAAVARCAASLTVQRSIGPAPYLAATFNVLAQAAEQRDLLAESARLLAAVDAQRRQFVAEFPGLPAAQQAAVARVRAALGEAAFAEAWAAGEALSADAAIEYGLDVVAQLQPLLAGARPS